jgi:hypothetical protein
MTTSATLTLGDFLLARIAEDEEGARDALGPSAYEWTDDGWTEAVMLAEGEGVQGATVELWRRFSPARVLAECEAKRRMVERHSECGRGWGYCDDGGHSWYPKLGCGDLADLARPYSDHADYRPEWTPGA